MPLFLVIRMMMRKLDLYIHWGFTHTSFFFRFFFLCFNFLSRCLALLFQNKISFLLIFSDIESRYTLEVRINDLLLWVFLRASAKFLHLHFWIFHISPPKTKIVERKQYGIMFALGKMIYIDIGYKSAHD